VIDGVSARTLAEIRRWERATGRPGKVALDLRWWKQEAARMGSHRWRGLHVSAYDSGYLGCSCCDDDAPEGRVGLERAMRALSPRSRRELAAVVGVIDARVLAATYGDEPTVPGWWARRM
jgi:hypothetical protein